MRVDPFLHSVNPPDETFPRMQKCPGCGSLALKKVKKKNQASHTTEVFYVDVMFLIVVMYLPNHLHLLEER